MVDFFVCFSCFLEFDNEFFQFCFMRDDVIFGWQLFEFKLVDVNCNYNCIEEKQVSSKDCECMGIVIVIWDVV